MVGENGPILPGWTVNPRACPFDIADCPICPSEFESPGTDEAHIIRGTE